MDHFDPRCQIRPFHGIQVADSGEVSMTLPEVQGVLGPGQPMRRFRRDERDWPDELYYSEAGLWVRFDFDDEERRCEFIEFNLPRRFPPTLDGRAVRGPTCREAVELLMSLGYDPDDRAMEDIRNGVLGHNPAGTDTVDFPSIGVSVWTSLATETDEDGELGEHILDTVSVWARGYRAE